ncbi:MAG: hypothetical protein K5891_08860 [Lachnospiraceae bacterium]|nr:hypothetical protein [Lachnospiraceae bacterium]
MSEQEKNPKAIPDFDEAITGITAQEVPDPELRALYQQLVRLRGMEKARIDTIPMDSRKPGGKLLKKIGYTLTAWIFGPVLDQIQSYRLEQEELIWYMLEYMKQTGRKADE